METADGQEFYPGLFLKAAIYWEGSAARHNHVQGSEWAVAISTFFGLCRRTPRIWPAADRTKWMPQMPPRR